MALSASLPAAAEPTAAAGAERSGFSKIFIAGPGPGEPSTGKLFTVYSFYTLAAGSLAVGGLGYFAHVDAKSEADDFLSRHGTPGPCFELTSLACEELERIRGDERRNLTLASLGLGASGLFLLSGVFTAQQWDNVQPSLITSSDGAHFNVRISF